jgi:hypothetical protein
VWDTRQDSARHKSVAKIVKFQVFDAGLFSKRFERAFELRQSVK